jgi:Right handed beta helix region
MSHLRKAARVSLSAIAFAAVSNPAHAATISVPAGGDLHSALMSAQPGDTIVLEPGATYIGNFTLPNKNGTTYITLQTSPDGLPGDGARVAPGLALAKLRSPNSAPALQTAPGAHHWRIALIEFLANAAGAGDIMTLGDGSPAQNTLALVPHDLIVDRCYIHADPGSPQKRGIALNSASTTITGSYIAGMKAVGQDSQAIAGWNGPGPYTITNNYLEGAGENVIFGGADPAIPNLVPSDITIAGNTVAKLIAWRTENWSVKNLLELKNARRVSIHDNTFEYNWQAGQSGFAILFTVRNQDGRCPWCQVEEVVFQDNIVRHSAAGVSILGYDNVHPSQQTRSIVIRNNLFADIDSKNWGGNGYFLMLLDGARDITVDHNTVIQDEAYGILTVSGPPVLGFVFTNNVARQNAYGMIGADHAPGLDTISAFFPGAQIEGNALADGDPARYPDGNRFPSSAEFRAQFVAYAAGDYRLTANSAWRGAGIDGRDLGASLDPASGDRSVSTRLKEGGN